MKQWIWQTQKNNGKNNLYENGEGNKIVGYSKLKFEHFSEVYVNVNDLSTKPLLQEKLLSKLKRLWNWCGIIIHQKLGQGWFSVVSG